MFQRWIDDIKAGAGATVRLSMLALAAGAALTVALAFLCAAAFVFVSQAYGPVIACLASAGLFLLVMLVVLAIHGEQKRRAEARRAEAAKRAAAAQSFLTDPVLLATGLRVAQAIGVKRLLPVIVIGGVALGLMAAARRDAPPDDGSPGP